MSAPGDQPGRGTGGHDLESVSLILEGHSSSGSQHSQRLLSNLAERFKSGDNPEGGYCAALCGRGFCLQLTLLSALAAKWRQS